MDRRFVSEYKGKIGTLENVIPGCLFIVFSVDVKYAREKFHYVGNVSTGYSINIINLTDITKCCGFLGHKIKLNKYDVFMSSRILQNFEDKLVDVFGNKLIINKICEKYDLFFDAIYVNENNEQCFCNFWYDNKKNMFNTINLQKNVSLPHDNVYIVTRTDTEPGSDYLLYFERFDIIYLEALMKNLKEFRSRYYSTYEESKKNVGTLEYVIPECLFIVFSVKVKYAREKFHYVGNLSTSYGFINIINLTDITKCCGFLGHKIKSDKYNVLSSSGILEKSEDKLVDVFGNKLIINKICKEYDLFFDAIYVNKNNKQYFCNFWYDAKDNLFHTLNLKNNVSLSYNKVYIATKTHISKFGNIFGFKCFDEIYSEAVVKNFKDIENGDLFVQLSADIISINVKYTEIYNRIILETHELLYSLVDLKIKPKITIICKNGSFIFYPTIIPILSDLKNSLFNTTTISSEDFIKLLDYSVDEIRYLFQIYMSEKLPTLEQLIKYEYFSEDILTIYANISDYLGFDFWYDYFNEIISREAYMSLKD
jgi:hypothetical protein